MFKRIFCYISLYAVLRIASLTSAHADDQHDCHTIAYWEGLRATEVVLDMVKEIYQKSNICADFVSMSLPDAEQQLINHKVTANGWRSDLFIEKYKDDLAVTIPIMFLENALYINETVISPDHEDLKLKNYRVAVARGDAHSNKSFDQLEAEKIEIESYPRLIKGFVAGEYEAMIIPNIVFIDYIIDNPVIDFEYTSKALVTIPYRHVVHQSHKDLIPILNAEIPRMLLKGHFRQRLEQRFFSD